MRFTAPYLPQAQLSFLLDDAGASILEVALLAALLAVVCTLGFLTLDKYT